MFKLVASPIVLVFLFVIECKQLYSVDATVLAAKQAHPFKDALKDPQNYSYGSGVFGQWIEDENGGPVYAYSLDQISDPRAIYNATVDPYQRLPTDHLFQLGNDRLVALASNYGYINVRTDEGGPKLLNDFYPVSGTQFGGGIGYLCANTTTSNNQLLLSTLFNHTTDPRCASARFDRHMGIGYVRKIVDGCSIETGTAATVTQDLIVPTGTDPAVVSVVTITNTGASAADFTWTETWAAAWYHLDLYSRQLQYTTDGLAGNSSRKASKHYQLGSGVSSYLADFRAFVANHYTPTFTPIENTTGLFPGVQAAFSYDGLSAEDVAEMARLEKNLAAEAATNAFVGPIQASFPAGASLWDEAPPTVSLLDVSQAGSGPTLSSDCASFFGEGGSRSPSGALLPFPSPFNATPAVRNGCLLARHTVSELPPGASVTFAYVWTYLTHRAVAEGLTAQSIAAKYAASAINGTLRAKTTAAFVAEVSGLRVGNTCERTPDPLGKYVSLCATLTGIQVLPSACTPRPLG